MAAPAVQTDIRGAIARLHDIGSTEIPRHVGKAIAVTVEGARDWMRAETKRTLGARVRGPGGIVRHEVPDYTINAIQATNVEYRQLGPDSPIPKGEVFVAAKQGVHGQDQSAYLKFQFGRGPQVRKPGDVGLSNSRILVWRPKDLVLAAKIGGINPFDPSGRQPRGLLGKLGLMADAGHEWGAPSKSDTMRDIARRDPERSILSLDTRLANAHARIGEGAISRMRQGRGFTQAVGRLAGLEGNYPWGVFRAPDPVSGIQTFKARPRRERDPAGGKHAFRRSDGTIGYMPNMIDTAHEYGEAGRMVGPRALFAARASVSYDPQLQAPWEAMQDRAQEELAKHLAEELAHAIERRDQGRSF